jgi:Family of unknown function (DUF6152)
MKRLFCSALLAGFILACGTAYAHHSVAAEFDESKPVTITGKITKVDWLNPHIWIYMDVAAKDGKKSAWQCEGGAPNTLTRNGWTKNSLKIGDELTVEGSMAKDASNTCKANAVKLADGRRVLAGNNNDPK